jgi:hypothetical protein
MISEILVATAILHLSGIVKLSDYDCPPNNAEKR